jgi:hypothetical protein
MSYVISGLPLEAFQPLFGLDDADLAARGVVRMTVTAKPGFPCRITLADAEPGETVLLLNHEHQPAATPYRSTHAIFVREAAEGTQVVRDAVPECLAGRLLSVRAFDADGMMTDAEVLEGAELEPLIARMFEDPAVAYLHVHNARRGCFAARVDRG